MQNYQSWTIYTICISCGYMVLKPSQRQQSNGTTVHSWVDLTMGETLFIQNTRDCRLIRQNPPQTSLELIESVSSYLFETCTDLLCQDWMTGVVSLLHFNDCSIGEQWCCYMLWKLPNIIIKYHLCLTPKLKQKCG